MQLRKATCLAMLVLSLATAATADEAYPAKPVMVVVPQAPGGANDVIARIVTTKLAEKLGRQVVVENRPGAGGNIGTAYVAKATPDGYSLLFTVSSAHVINPALYKRTGFDPVRDFIPVGSAATAGYVLVANPAFRPGSVRELVDLARAKPDTVTFASAGNGTLNHLIGEMIQQSAGIRLVHVPYKGAAAAVSDVVGGQVAVSVQSVTSAQAFIRAGKLKVLAVTQRKAPACDARRANRRRGAAGSRCHTLVWFVCTGAHAACGGCTLADRARQGIGGSRCARDAGTPGV